MTENNQSLTLQDRINESRIEKVAAIQRTVKSLAKNPTALNFSLVIQRNLRWTVEQKSSLIESILLGYPIPAIYALRSEDKEIWVLDGKQRIDGSLIRFCNDEWALKGLPLVYGLDINGMTYSMLPDEFKELIADQSLTFYQFEKLTTDQRDQLFKRLNSGTALSAIELTRSVLGSEMLDYFNSLIATPFMQKVSLNLNSEKFVDQELILQSIAIITGKSFELSGKAMKAFALDLRTNGLTEDEKIKVNTVFDFLSDAFADIDDKTAKKVLKKADVVAIVANVWNREISPETFSGLITGFIASQPSYSNYSNTKSNQCASSSSIITRIDILDRVLDGAIKPETTKQDEDKMTA